MTDVHEELNKLRLELRRGMIVLAVLSQLRIAQYGYSLIQLLSQKGFEIEEGTLYPLLRRLEKQGLLVSEWETSESHPRKYYRISPAGQTVLDTLSQEWRDTVSIMASLLGEENNG